MALILEVVELVAVEPRGVKLVGLELHFDDARAAIGQVPRRANDLREIFLTPGGPGPTATLHGLAHAAECACQGR